MPCKQCYMHKHLTYSYLNVSWYITNTHSRFYLLSSKIMKITQIIEHDVLRSAPIQQQMHSTQLFVFMSSSIFRLLRLSSVATFSDSRACIGRHVHEAHTCSDHQNWVTKDWEFLGENIFFGTHINSDYRIWVWFQALKGSKNCKE